MKQQANLNQGQGKVMLRYLNGPTETYQFETKFSMGLTGMVSPGAAKEMLSLRYEGKEMFVLA